MNAVELYKMCESVGIKPWSDDLLGKLLAWAMVTGFMECTVLLPMYDVLMVAAYRFNIGGGLVPNMSLYQEFCEPRIAELRKLKQDTPWLPSLMERYKVSNWQRMEYTW